MSAPLHIAALLTCHNRRALTLACLAALHQQQLAESVRLDVVLVDDGSTDGTAEAVKSAYPEVEVIAGDGSLFWCNGMRRAWTRAAECQPDFYLLLNDDTQLYPRAVATLLAAWRTCEARGRPASILVGSCRDPQTGRQNYGGVVHAGRHPLNFALVEPGNELRPCDTFNANMVLVPRAVYQVLGMLDSFEHAMGDIDYGLRARQAGCEILVAPGFLADCPDNPKAERWRDKSLSWPVRWRQFTAPTHLPPRSWLKLTRRHSGWLWPLFFVSPYVRFVWGKK